MKNSVENLSETRVKLTVEVPASEFAPDYDKAAKVLAKQVNIPGFRPGKAPRRVLESKIGKGYIIEQAINDNLDKYYQQAVAEADISPMSRPEVDITEVPEMKGKDDKTALKFTVEVDVRPVIALPNPADVTVEVAGVAVTDAEVDKELDSLRERFGTLSTVERSAEKGDYVNIDMVATIGEEDVDDVAGVSYRIGDNSMLEGQDEALTGAVAGDVVEFKSALVGGDHAGEEADVKVTVNSVKESILPDADDDFAQLASEFDTIEELKDDLRANVAKTKANLAVIDATRKLAEEVIARADFPLPQSVIDEEVANHLSQEGKEADDPHGEEIRGDIEEALRSQLLLDEYAKQFNVAVDHNELLEFMVDQARAYGMDPNQFIQAAVQANQLGAFQAEIARNKAMMAALRLAKVVDEAGNEVDLSEALGEPGAEETIPDFSEVPVKQAEEVEVADEADSDDAAFDPSAHKVDDVVAYLNDADDAEKARVLAAEKAGKARKTILALEN
ncbi:MAG: trigger factor [Actinomycetaceae bacterium]|nr:trigger factor [Actinomycetaceae bacterium]